MKKVLLISHDLTVTGAPLSLKGIASLLNEDYDLTFWSMKGGPLRDFLEKDLNISPEIVTNEQTDNFVKIAKAMSQFDFVIVNTVVCNRFASICKDFNIPYIWIIREAQNISDYQIRYPELFKTIKSCKDNIYVVSEYAAQCLQNMLNIKVKVIHNFVDDEYKNKEIKLSDKINFTFVGTIQKIKGVDILVDAINQLPQQFKDSYSLSILGEYVDKRYKNELLEKQNNNPSVNWCGVVVGEERQKIFEETDVFVVPSLFESSSRVALEACMMGRPVIVTEDVGAKYLVNEKTGWIVKTGDVEDLKKCIENILKNPQVLPEMGKAAREIYLKTSTPDIYKKNLYKIISVLPKKSVYIPLKILLLKIFSIHYLSKYKLTYVLGFKIKQKYNPDNHFKKLLQQIFSIKNSYDRRHKVITIFGIKIKLRKNNLLNNIFTVENIDIYKVLTIWGKKFKFIRPLKKQERAILKQYLNHKIKDNTVLLIEPNNCHGEVLPGIAKYFLDLGYNVDVIVTESEFALKPFGKFDESNINIMPMRRNIIWHFLNNNYVKNKYKIFYFNTDHTFEPITQKESSVEQYFPLNNIDSQKIIYLSHSPNKYKDCSGKNLILANLPVKNKEHYKLVNSHYFGNTTITSKNNITNFIVIGNIESTRKNYNLLIDSVEQLLKQGISNFKITVIARTGKLNLPENIIPFIDFKGRLDYPQMYESLEKADFFLTLLDPDNPEHDRYITNGTSGSFQLIYGLVKPCIINKKFATVPGFDDKNSIVYEQNSDLVESMKKAIYMPTTDYEVMQNNLKEYADKLYQTSLENLKNIL